MKKVNTKKILDDLDEKLDVQRLIQVDRLAFFIVDDEFHQNPEQLNRIPLAILDDAYMALIREINKRNNYQEEPHE